jgi:hypothetical protein
METVFATMMEFVNVKLDGVELIVMNNIVHFLQLTIKYAQDMDNVDHKLNSNVYVKKDG